MSTGTVKFYNPEKGFGFIRQDEDPTGESMFVHVSGILHGIPLEKGDRVEVTKDGQVLIDDFRSFLAQHGKLPE